MARNLKVIRFQTANGENHYVVCSLKSNENPAGSEDFDEAKFRRDMKKEAAKPLLLLRAE